MEIKPLRYSKNHKGKLCQVFGCVCERESESKRNTCHRHSYVQKLLANPYRVYYNALKGNAKRREKYFDITLEQFKTFCISTDYLALKGIGIYDYSIDRIDQLKGYTIDNIQILSNYDNIMKYRDFYNSVNQQYENVYH